MRRLIFCLIMACKLFYTPSCTSWRDQYKRAMSWENFLYGICEQHRRRSAPFLFAAYVIRYNIQNFKTRTRTDRFECYLIANPRRQVFSWHCSLITWRSLRTLDLLFWKINQESLWTNRRFCFSFVLFFIKWAPSIQFVSSSIPSWQISTAHAQPFRGTRDLAFCLKVRLDSLLVWASSGGSGETARMRRLAWTFAARIGDKYQIRLTWPKLFLFYRFNMFRAYLNFLLKPPQGHLLAFIRNTVFNYRLNKDL